MRTRYAAGPLIIGVIAGLVFANIDIHAYEDMVDYHIFGENTKIFGKAVTVHFLINEIFMVFLSAMTARRKASMSAIWSRS